LHVRLNDILLLGAKKTSPRPNVPLWNGPAAYGLGGDVGGPFAGLLRGSRTCLVSPNRIRDRGHRPTRKPNLRTRRTIYSRRRVQRYAPVNRQSKSKLQAGFVEKKVVGPSIIMSSITSALTAPASPGGEAAAALREGLLQRASPRREAIEQLRERVDALRRELDAAQDGAEAAEAGARHAEEREREAAAELHAAASTGRTQGEKLRNLEDELRYKDGRIKVLEAIVKTMTAKKK
jgi:hypothetical protein